MGSRKRFESFACCKASMSERANVTRHMRGSGGDGLRGEKICRRVSRALARGKETRKVCGFPIIEMEWQRMDISLKVVMGIGDHDAEKMILLIRRDAGLFEKTALVGSKYACVKYWKNEFACIPTELPSQ